MVRCVWLKKSPLSTAPLLGICATPASQLPVSTQSCRSARPPAGGVARAEEHLVLGNQLEVLGRGVVHAEVDRRRVGKLPADRVTAHLPRRPAARHAAEPAPAPPPRPARLLLPGPASRTVPTFLRSRRSLLSGSSRSPAWHSPRASTARYVLISPSARLLAASARASAHGRGGARARCGPPRRSGSLNQILFACHIRVQRCGVFILASAAPRVGRGGMLRRPALPRSCAGGACL